MVAHACKPRIWDAMARGPQIQGQLGQEPVSKDVVGLKGDNDLPSTHKCLGSVTSTTENKSKTETKTNKAKHGSIHDTEPCILFAYKLRIQSANEAMVCCKLSSSAPLCPESSGL